MKKLQSYAVAAALMVAVLLPSMKASATTDIAPIGATLVVLTATPNLVGLGVDISPLGLATASPDLLQNIFATFPISGGTLDPDVSNAVIRHEGSGLALSRAGTTVNIENFVIDTTLPTDTVFGRVTIGSTVLSNVPLFSLTGPNISLTSTAGGALASSLGIPDLTGVQVGYALTNPLPVPEPETYAMMALGLGLLGLLRHARKNKAATFGRRAPAFA